MNTDKFSSWAEDIMEHAMQNYESDGWDYICECWTLEELETEIAVFHTFDDALAHIGSLAHAWAEARDEVQAEIF